MLMNESNPRQVFSNLSDGQEVASTVEQDSRTERENEIINFLREFDKEERRNVFRNLTENIRRENPQTNDAVWAIIDGNYTRADNIGCGINQESMHEYAEAYFRDKANRSEDAADAAVYREIEYSSHDMAVYRAIIKSFLYVDQITNKRHYDSGVPITSDELTMDSSLLGDIKEREFSDETVKKLKKLVAMTKQLIPELKQTFKEKVAVLQAHEQYFPLDVAKKQSMLATGVASPDVGNRWKDALDSMEEWTGALETALESNDPELMHEALSEFMDKFTKAEALLESSHYYATMCKLRDVDKKNMETK